MEFYTLRPTLTADDFGEDFLYTGNLTYPDCNLEPCTSLAGEDITAPILSAIVQSTYSFKYGRVEVRAQVPRGDWLWPAIWMQPKYSVYGPWPRSGEIDIMETKGNVNYFDSHGVSQGVDRVMSTLHWGPDGDHNEYMKTHWEISMEGTGHTYADDFHLYGMTWTENYINFTVDNKEIGTVNAPEDGFWYYGNFENDPGGTNIWQNGSKFAPFDQEFYFIFNVGVGGYFFADDIGNRPWNWDGHPRADFWESRAEWLSTWNEEDVAMKIDYVRVYQ